MSKKEDKSHKDSDRKIDESIWRKKREDRDSYRDGYRDVDRMQAPDKWPDPPEEQNKNGRD